MKNYTLKFDRKNNVHKYLRKGESSGKYVVTQKYLFLSFVWGTKMYFPEDSETAYFKFDM